jgi:hypothetical protein
MSIDALENLVKINQLKVEPPDPNEFNGMLAAATSKLQDVTIPALSADSKFSLAYGAAHALALAALRWHGYRSESRYLVFQCLQHTLGIEKAKWRVLDKCHQCRNLAEYEGHVEIDSQLLKELVQITQEVLDLVRKLDPIQS